MENTSTYIKALVTPQAKQGSNSRKVWSIDLETVWLPFFTATNTMGDTSLPSEALGAPLRLGYNKDGTVKFSNAGKPVIRVAKELSDSVKMVRENFVAGLQAYANGVATENPDGFKAQIAKSVEAGMPILTRDNSSLKDAYAKIVAEQIEAELKAKGNVQPPADVKPEPATSEKPAPKPKARKATKTPKVLTEPTEPQPNGDHAEPTHEPDKEPVHGEPVLVS